MPNRSTRPVTLPPILFNRTTSTSPFKSTPLYTSAPAPARIATQCPRPMGCDDQGQDAFGPSPVAADVFEPELLLGPEHHGPAVEEGDDRGLDDGRIAVAERRERHHHIALIVECDGQHALAFVFVRCPVGTAEPLHPADLDGAAGTERPEFPPHQSGIGDPLQLGIVGYAGGAVAEADLRPNIDVDLDAAIGRRADEGFADAPLIQQKRPFGLGPDRLDCARIGRRPDAEHGRGPRNEADPDNGNRKRNRALHRIVSAAAILPRIPAAGHTIQRKVYHGPCRLRKLPFPAWWGA